MRVWTVFSFFLRDKSAERIFLESANTSRGYEIRRARMDNRFGPMIEVQTAETRTVVEQKKILTRINYHVHSGVAWCNNQCYLHVYYRDGDCDARNTWIFINDFGRREEMVSLSRDHLTCDAKYVDTTRIEPRADHCVDIVSHPDTVVFRMFGPTVEFDDIRAAVEFAAACCEIGPHNKWTWATCLTRFRVLFPEFSYMLNRMRHVRRATPTGNVYPPEYPAGAAVVSDDAPSFLENMMASLNPFGGSGSSGSFGSSQSGRLPANYHSVHVPASDFTAALE